MKIAMLQNRNAFATVMSDATVERLQTMGEVTFMMENVSAADAIRDADAAVTTWGSPSLTEELLNAAPNLRFVSHAAGSVKSVVTDIMYNRGIRITSAAQVLSGGVSETALGLTIATTKNFFALNAETHNGGWSHTGITEMYGITIGIIGFGIAGRHYAELLQNFAVKVIAYDPGITAEQMAEIGVQKASLEEIFAQSDVLSIHAPEIPSTYHIVNADSLASMKDNAILINTARGSLVDEVALVEALQRGKLKVACLDVTDPEPPAADSPLRKLDNCILTPHIAGQANNGLKRVGDHACDQIENFFAGKALSGEVTQAMLANMA